MSSEKPSGMPALPSDWQWELFENLCDRISVGHVGETNSFFCGEEGIPFIRSQNVRPGRLEIDDIRYVTKDFHAKSKKSQLEPGDILIVRVGQNRGDCAVVPKGLGELNCANIVLAKTNRSYSNYLGYFFNSPLGREALLSLSSGSAQLVLNTKAIAKVIVPVPPKNDAVEIGLFLKSLDDRITILRETNTTLEDIAQALFKSWFVDFDPVRAKQEGREPEGMDADTAVLFPDSFEESELGLVPKGWIVKRLGDITERITKGTTPTTLKRPFVESGINFVKVESITGNGEFIPEKFAYIDSETHELLKRSQLSNGDVLITIAGTIGRIAVMTEDFLPANTNQAVALIRPDESIFPGGLIKHFLQRDDSRQTMVERVVQAVQANLSLGSISDLKVIVPPAETVKLLYAAGIEQVNACKQRNQQHIRTLATLRDTLLPRLISGQLRLPDAEALVEEAAA